MLEARTEMHQELPPVLRQESLEACHTRDGRASDDYDDGDDQSSEVDNYVTLRLSSIDRSLSAGLSPGFTTFFLTFLGLFFP